MLPSPRTCIRDFSGESEDMVRLMVLFSIDGDNEDDGRRNSIMRPREKQIAEELFPEKRWTKNPSQFFILFLIACTPYALNPLIN